MPTVNKSSLDNIVKSVLSVANAEQNMSWSPNIITSQYNVVTSLLLSKLIEDFEDDGSKLDMLMSFMKIKKIPVTDGYIQLPDDYRNLLGRPAINVRPDGKDCMDDSPPINSPQTFKVANLKAGCRTVYIDIVPQNEFDDRTISTYAFPTIDAPIGCIFNNQQIKVCPYDLGKVEVRYTRQENLVNYGYIMQPDDTFLFDKNTSVESEWTSAAFTPIFNAMLALYGAYVKDNTLTDWATILREKGIL